MMVIGVSVFRLTRSPRFWLCLCLLSGLVARCLRPLPLHACLPLPQLFGKVTGQTFYNLVKLDELALDVDENDRPRQPCKIIKVRMHACMHTLAVKRRWLCRHTCCKCPLTVLQFPISQTNFSSVIARFLCCPWSPLALPRHVLPGLA